MPPVIGPPLPQQSALKKYGFRLLIALIVLPAALVTYLTIRGNMAMALAGICLMSLAGICFVLSLAMILPVESLLKPVKSVGRRYLSRSDLKSELSSLPADFVG